MVDFVVVVGVNFVLIIRLLVKCCQIGLFTKSEADTCGRNGLVQIDIVFAKVDDFSKAIAARNEIVAIALKRGIANHQIHARKYFEFRAHAGLE